MRFIVTTALLLSLPGTALATDGDETWERWEAQEIMRAEMERARKLGGYSDPLTALRNILNGEATEKDITYGYRDIYDLPEYGGPPVTVPEQR